MTVSTRIAVMREGRVAQLGEPRQIYEAPSSRYVAEFIGDVNILAGRAEADGTVELEAGGRVRLTGAAPAAGRDVALALRPEKLSIARAEGPAAENALAGQVEDIAYLGDISIYHVRLAGGALVKAARTNRIRAEEAEITWEDPVHLAWDPSAAVLLLD